MEEKNGGTKNVTIDCSSQPFTAQTDTVSKTLKGEMITTLNNGTYPSRPNKPRVVSQKELPRGLGSRDNIHNNVF